MPYSCLGIAGNIFSVRANAVINYLPRRFLQKTRPHKEQSRPIPTFRNISRQIPFSFQFLSSKMIILWFCLNSRVDWMFDFCFSESRTVLYTQIVRTHPISAKIHISEAVYFLIYNDNSGICSWYITLV